ncbi:unnamed protein product [Rotaria sp. Silwood1]|nr:unnamed protein product [Rotaria sp. Silwood1]
MSKIYREARIVPSIAYHDFMCISLTVNDVASGLITKCLNARSKMKERACEILLMYIEIEKQIEIEDELVKGLDNKQPKIVQACLEILRKGLSEFGSKILPIKPFLKQIIPLLDDRDKTVRDESKLLIVEIYKWIGKQTLMPMIQNVKPIQTNLEQFSEVAVILLAHKTPIVRQCTQQFLTKCFSMATQTTLPKKILKIYLQPLIKNTGEADPTVRDSAFESLGMLWKCLGEKHILPNLTEMDELKLNKIKEYAEKSVLLNFRGEPRSTASVTITNTTTTSPVSPVIIKKNKPTSTEVPINKLDEESKNSKPPIVVKKKPIIIVKSPPTTTNETLEEKKKELRPPKSAAPISNPVPRISSGRSKPTVANTSSSNVKPTISKVRPVTALPSKSTTIPTTTITNNTQSRTQRLIPIVQSSTTKIRTKPPLSTNRRSSFGSTLSSSTSNLQRQSTSTGGSTSSLSSTNTQASIPCTRSETPTSSTTITILRSVSNDIISSPNTSNINTKSRIPIRTIPINVVKKSLT